MQVVPGRDGRYGVYSWSVGFKTSPKTTPPSHAVQAQQGPDHFLALINFLFRQGKDEIAIKVWDTYSELYS